MAKLDINWNLGNSWFHVSSGQRGVGEGVPCSARALRGHLVLHHHLTMLASTVMATILSGSQPIVPQSCVQGLIQPGAPLCYSWAPAKLCACSQAASRHEKLSEAVQVPSLLQATTELIGKAMLLVIPYIRVLSTPWNWWSTSATLLLLWSLSAC